MYNLCISEEGIMMGSYTKRWAAEVLREVLSFQRTAVVVGARQSGKTTMVRREMPVPAQYVTLDDPDFLSLSKNDPAFLVKMGGSACLVIDEIQKAPDLISRIKMQVDRDNRPAQFVLTGSADYRRLPQVTDSLAGRTVFIRLRGMTEAEARGKQPVFLKNMFDRNIPSLGKLETCSKKDAFELALKGGYPAAKELPPKDRSRYFESYIESQIQHDLSQNWNMVRLGALRDLLRYAAIYSSKLLNISEISSRVEASRQTVTGYLKSLEAMYLIDTLPAWLHNDYVVGSKVPKLFMNDTGLLAYFHNIQSADFLLNDIKAMSDIGGKLFETWVYNQIAAEVSLNPGWRISHFRNGNRQEIDFMIEDSQGRLLGIETKSSETLGAEDAKHLRWFAERARHPFTGIVLYAGNNITSFGNGVYGVPYSALWPN
jgi:predicted AAA+ superfamily ATPase